MLLDWVRTCSNSHFSKRNPKKIQKKSRRLQLQYSNTYETFIELIDGSTVLTDWKTLQLIITCYEIGTLGTQNRDPNISLQNLSVNRGKKMKFSWSFNTELVPIILETLYMVKNYHRQICSQYHKFSQVSVFMYTELTIFT